MTNEEEIKDLSKRVEALEKQIKEDKEEQLKKLKAEVEYAKYRCSLENTKLGVRNNENTIC